VFLLFYILDGEGVFASHLGNVQRSSTRRSGMWICWRTVSSSYTWYNGSYKLLNHF